MEWLKKGFLMHNHLVLMDREIEQRSFGTHDGRFHADEVTACALLLYFKQIDWDKIYRTRASEVLAKCEYVCDVGGLYDPKMKLFDHHQADYQGSMSSAGMVLKDLLDRKRISEAMYKWLDEELVHGVDAYDNGKELLVGRVATFSHIIANFAPISYDASPVLEDQAFFQALQFAFGHIARLIERFEYTQSCKELVKKAMDEGDVCLMFDVGIPWLDSFFELGGKNHPASFVIMPAKEHWKLRGIPPSLDERMKVRVPLPSAWAGLLEDDLKKVTGIQGAIFCHKGRFISVWQTKEDAMKALQMILKEK